MPVLGHAFVGLTTAVYTRPGVRRSVGAALWTPILVGLAYLPDIVGQFCELAGAGRWRTATHSLLFAVVASIGLTGPVASLAGISLKGAFGLALFSVLTHDVLDLFQGTDCCPFWPFSDAHVNLPDRSIASGLGQEVVLFGGACAVLILAWALIRWRIGRKRVQLAGRRGLAWAGYALTAVILLLAAGTHYLRDVRRQQYLSANALLKTQPAEALLLLDQAERWPYLGSPARMNYSRAEAYRRLGDRDRAEQYYLAALRDGRNDFWIIADVALFYASQREPLEARRKRVEPLAGALRERFANHPSLPRTLAKIENRMGPARRAAAGKNPATRPRAGSGE